MSKATDKAKMLKLLDETRDIAILALGRLHNDWFHNTPEGVIQAEDLLISDLKKKVISMGYDDLSGLTYPAGAIDAFNNKDLTTQLRFLLRTIPFPDLCEKISGLPRLRPEFP